MQARYISLQMDVAQDLMYITLHCMYPKLLMTLFLNFESSILLKYHVSCNFMLKYYITVSLRQFTKTLNQFFDLSRANESLEGCMPV